jgi:hypothetical protein
MSLVTQSKYKDFLTRPTLNLYPPDADYTLPVEYIVSGATILVNITAPRTLTFPSVAEIEEEYTRQTGRTLQDGEILPKDVVITSRGAFQYSFNGPVGVNIVNTGGLTNESALLKIYRWDTNDLDITLH